MGSLASTSRPRSCIAASVISSVHGDATAGPACSNELFVQMHSNARLPTRARRMHIVQFPPHTRRECSACSNANSRSRRAPPDESAARAKFTQPARSRTALSRPTSIRRTRCRRRSTTRTAAQPSAARSSCCSPSRTSTACSSRSSSASPCRRSSAAACCASITGYLETPAPNRMGFRRLESHAPAP